MNGKDSNVNSAKLVTTPPMIVEVALLPPLNQLSLVATITVMRPPVLTTALATNRAGGMELTIVVPAAATVKMMNPLVLLDSPRSACLDGRTGIIARFPMMSAISFSIAPALITPRVLLVSPKLDATALAGMDGREKTVLNVPRSMMQAGTAVLAPVAILEAGRTAIATAMSSTIALGMRFQ